MRETIDTTYADLRPTDLVIDKSGQEWPISEYDNKPDSGDQVMFWLCDRVSGIKLHLIVDMGTRPVKVSRKLPTQADEAAKLEADFPKSSAPDGAGVSPTVSATTETPQEPKTTTTGPSEIPAGDNVYANAVVSLHDAVATVGVLAGGEVVAEVTAAEVDAAAAATDDAPLTLPPFADMTPLEARSHLYLLHGLYGSDVTGKAELIAIHADAHAQHDAGTLQSRHVPHVHEEA